MVDTFCTHYLHNICTWTRGRLCHISEPHHRQARLRLGNSCESEASESLTWLVPMSTAQNQSRLPSTPTGSPIFFLFSICFVLSHQGGHLSESSVTSFSLESTFQAPSFPLLLQLTFMDLIICIFVLFGSKCFLVSLDTSCVTLSLFRRAQPSLSVSQAQDFLPRIKYCFQDRFHDNWRRSLSHHYSGHLEFIVTQMCFLPFLPVPSFHFLPYSSLPSYPLQSPPLSLSTSPFPSFLSFIAFMCYV